MGKSYACRNCEHTAPKKLQAVMNRKRNTTHTSRFYEKYEQPREVRAQTKALLKAIPKVPDTPAQRDIARTDSPKPRHTIFEYGSTGKSSRNARVMTKLINKLGPNPKILKDDGFQVIAESTVL